MKFSIKEKKFLEHDTAPDLLAVSDENCDITWHELSVRTSHYETQLKALGIKSGQAVAILGHKQVDYIAAICACIAMGCPYIPLDDIYPKDRILKILSISQASCLIDLKLKKIDTAFINWPIKEFSPEDDLIYIIFTSGSTGDPKGVQISRESVLSLLRWMQEDFQLPTNAVFMSQAPFSFDLSVYETMYFLTYGKSIILNSRDTIAQKSTFISRLKAKNINTWVSTPSFAWMQTTSEEFNQEFLPTVECFLFCGENLTLKLVKKLRLLFPKARILNTYGPTEATVATTIIEINDEIIAKYDPLPVGYPKKGTEVYTDENNEICIVGDNVMSGYLNREDLNSSKMFIKNELRGFKTGDQGRLADGMLFFQGRLDDQIKLHGYRIELSEIDFALATACGVKEAASIPIKRGEEVIRLIAFIKLDEKDTTTFDVFKDHIKQKLPSYMVPSEFILLKEFPMSNNHKIDRKKLKEIYQNEEVVKWNTI